MDDPYGKINLLLIFAIVKNTRGQYISQDFFFLSKTNNKNSQFLALLYFKALLSADDILAIWSLNIATASIYDFEPI